MFVEMLESDYFCWCRILSKKFIVAIIMFNILVALQVACQHVVEFVISKTTCSRKV